MQRLHQLNQPVWSPIAIALDDSRLMTDVKKIVANMVLFEPIERIPMATVEEELKKLLGEGTCFASKCGFINDCMQKVLYCWCSNH